MAEIPAISDVPFGSPDIIRELKLAVDTLAGRIGGNVDYGTIDGVRTKVLDIVHLCNMGRIKARAYRNAAQNIVAGPTKVLIDTIIFDTEGVVDIANSLIVPNLPGYYIVMGNVVASDVPDGRLVNAMIYKNGVWASYGTIDHQGSAGRSSSIASDLIYMNGTTDYLELFAHNSHSSALALYTGDSYQNYISIVGPF
jgi:hypothetical protein